MVDWAHQLRSLESVEQAIAAGEKRICLTIPTGGGKTHVACRLIDRWAQDGMNVALYTNRRMLVEQLSRVLDAHGIDHGIRAAGHSDDGKHHRVQIASIQTEDARVNRKKTWQPHDAQRVVIDEAHINKSDVARGIMDSHVKEGAVVVGLTATPLGIGDIYHHLVVGGTNSELRACGALVPAYHYGPDEPDLKQFGRAARAKLAAGQDLSEADQRQVFSTPGIFGRVLEWFEKLNPKRLPTILFASGVRESLWFAEQFSAAGMPAAHIDGQAIWMNGEVYRTGVRTRKELLEASQSGEITVLCNRFVLREGIDAPWLRHGIFASCFGSLQSYLQSGGRLLRASPGKEFCTIQDHAGMWWRHGSLNADREWRLDYTAAMAAGMREERLRTKKEREPCRCPRCGMILGFLKCLCGYVVQAGLKPSRPVVQIDGTLREMMGDIFKPRRAAFNPHKHTEAYRQQLISDWKRMYYRSKTQKGARTFNAAMALFAQEHNWGWPDERWPLMPKNWTDRWRKVALVPMEDLT